MFKRLEVLLGNGTISFYLNKQIGVALDLLDYQNNLAAKQLIACSDVDPWNAFLQSGDREFFFFVKSKQNLFENFYGSFLRAFNSIQQLENVELRKHRLEISRSKLQRSYKSQEARKLSLALASPV